MREFPWAGEDFEALDPRDEERIQRKKVEEEVNNVKLQANLKKSYEACKKYEVERTENVEKDLEEISTRMSALDDHQQERNVGSFLQRMEQDDDGESDDFDSRLIALSRICERAMIANLRFKFDKCFSRNLINNESFVIFFDMK